MQQQRARSGFGIGAAALIGAVVAVAALPAGARQHAFRYEIMPDDTLWHLARRFHVSVKQIRAWNPKVDPKELRPGAKLVIRAARRASRGRRRRCVEVQPGDSLWSIARRLGTSVRALRVWNRVSDARRLRVGRSLCVTVDLPKKDSIAVGTPQRGRLVNGEQMRSGPGYHVKEPGDSYGVNELLTMVYTCIGKVRPRRGSTLVIGDLSREHGGPIPQHVSHQNGTDIDIGYYYLPGVKVPTDRFIRRPDRVDLRRTWSLMRCLIDTGEVRYIFVDRALQRRLYRLVRRRRLYPKRDLDRIFEYGAGRPRHRRTTILLHAPNHDDHFHVRIFCPRDDISPKGRRGCTPLPGGRPVKD